MKYINTERLELISLDEDNLKLAIDSYRKMEMKLGLNSSNKELNDRKKMFIK